MNIIEINKIVIGLFFIYIVMFSSDIQLILNCELQKIMKENIYFRHILVFISIYLFVFILKWYNIESIVVKDNFNNLNNNNNNNQNVDNYNRLKNSTKYLTDSLILTFIAYIIFLISTKVEGKIFKNIIGIIFISILLQIISKAHNEDLHNLVMNYGFIFDKKKNKIMELSKENNIMYDNFIVILHNLTFVLYVMSLVIILYGSYQYYLKQKKSYGSNWKWNKFIFGIKKCKNI